MTSLSASLRIWSQHFRSLIYKENKLLMFFWFQNKISQFIEFNEENADFIRWRRWRKIDMIYWMIRSCIFSPHYINVDNLENVSWPYWYPHVFLFNFLAQTQWVSSSCWQGLFRILYLIVCKSVFQGKHAPWNSNKLCPSIDWRKRCAWSSLLITKVYPMH